MLGVKAMDLSTITTADPDRLPAEPGAYLIFLHLDGLATLPPRFEGLHLPRGRYVYAGSAYGSGGIRARCRRHLLQRDVRHWHIDWLTHVAGEMRIVACPGSNECDLISRLSSLPAIRLPVPGFGSSDCRRCPAHLAQVVGDHDFDDIALQIGFHQ